MEAVRLTDFYYSWFLGELERTGANVPTLREGNLFSFRIGDKSYITGFEKATADDVSRYLEEEELRPKKVRKETPKLSFVAFRPSSEEYSERILDNFESKFEEIYGNLPRDERSAYRRTFAEPYANTGEIGFNGGTMKGVEVRAPIIRIPTGDAGKLSEKLFRYSRKLFVAPLLDS